MQYTWIVTANAGHAHFYNVNKEDQSRGPQLEEINTLVNPSASLQTADTETDKLGIHSASKSTHSVGQPTQPSGYEPNQTPAEHQAEMFARNVVSFLQRSQQQGLFKQLIISASPEFLGILRQLMDSNLQQIVVCEIDKDYTRLQGKELYEMINARRRAA